MYGSDYQRRMNAIYKQTRPDFTYGAGSDCCDDIGLLYAALALNGEAGEVAEKVKRIVRGDYEGMSIDEVRAKIQGELGDVLYCVCMVCAEMGLELNDVMLSSVVKFESRLRRGVLQGEGDDR